MPFASGTREFYKLQVFLASNSTLLVALQRKVMVGTLGNGGNKQGRMGINVVMRERMHILHTPNSTLWIL